MGYNFYFKELMTDRHGYSDIGYFGKRFFGPILSFQGKQPIVFISNNKI